MQPLYKSKEVETSKMMLYLLIVMFALASFIKSDMAKAGMEEVIILNVEQTNVQQCTPPAADHSIVNSGTAVGAGVGAVVGNQLSKNKGTGTVVGGIAGALIGNQLNKQSATPAQQCVAVPRYKVSYKRKNEQVGQILMSSMPVGKSTVINFCGDTPC